MQKIVTVLMTIWVATAIAQETVDQTVGEFNEIKVFDLIEVNLIQGDEHRVVIKGQNTGDVKIINDDGTLKLRMQLEKRFDGSETFVEVYYTHIDVIDANEGSRIVTNSMIEQNTIELRAQEGGQIKAGLKVNHAKLKAVTGGILEVSGAANSQEVVLSTGGIMEGRSFITSNTDISVTAAGSAEVYASEQAKIRVTAGGDVHVYGNPGRVDQKSFAGGRIVVRDN
jgi:hypothetical protein